MRPATSTSKETQADDYLDASLTHYIILEDSAVVPVTTTKIVSKERDAPVLSDDIFCGLMRYELQQYSDGEDTKNNGLYIYSICPRRKGGEI